MTERYTVDGLEPISFEDSSHITLSVRNDFICKIVTDRYLGLLKEAFKTVLGFDVDITLVVPSTPRTDRVMWLESSKLMGSRPSM